MNDLRERVEALLNICDKRGYKDSYELFYMGHDNGSGKIEAMLTVGDFRALLVPREEEPGLRDIAGEVWDVVFPHIRGIGAATELYDKIRAKFPLAARPVEAKAEAGIPHPQIVRFETTMDGDYVTVRRDALEALENRITVSRPAPADALRALDAAKTVLMDIYKREGESFHGSRVKADIASIMPVIDAALRSSVKEGT